jgi:hypothetical protein
MRVLTALLACLLLAACSSVKVLEPAHTMAVENQQNLEANVSTLTDAFLKIAREHPAYEESDEQFLTAIVKTVKEQTAVASAYIALTGVYIKSRDIDAKAFENLLRDIPALVADGKNIWDELQALLNKEE